MTHKILLIVENLFNLFNFLIFSWQAFFQKFKDQQIIFYLLDLQVVQSLKVEVPSQYHMFELCHIFFE